MDSIIMNLEFVYKKHHKNGLHSFVSTNSLKVISKIKLLKNKGIEFWSNISVKDTEKKFFLFNFSVPSVFSVVYFNFTFSSVVNAT